MNKQTANWLRLAICLLLIWGTITQLHHFLPGKTTQQLFKENQVQDLDAGALFYSDSPEAVEAHYDIKKKLKKEKTLQKQAGKLLGEIFK